MSRRVILHDILIAILGTQGLKDTRVYFQPPSTFKMKYPCIVYSRSQIDEKHADNLLYLHRHAYTVIAIDADPDSVIPEKILQLPLCRFDRHYTVDNLNHDVFTLYY